MRLFASYNVFSGIELLQYSINSIRAHVDHVNVVYQTTSNTGKTDKSVLDKMKRLKGVDSFIEFTPNLSLTPKQNETRKRNIGLEQAKKGRFTHFISMDTDELYASEQFKRAKRIMRTGDYDSSVCQMQTYYHSPLYRLTPPEEYYVPFIYKIDDREFKSMQWPVIADPSRQMKPNRIKIFNRKELEMHHFSYVRVDIREKLNNASSSVNYKARIDDIATWYESWTYPMKAYLAGSEENYSEVEKVDNQFNIEL